MASIYWKRENKAPTEGKPKQLLFFVIKIRKWSRIYAYQIAKVKFL